jgi:hypothetical protein
MVQGELAQQPFSLGGQVDGYLPAVDAVALPLHQTVCDQAVNQLHRAVVADLQPLRQRADTGLDPLGKAADNKQQLVLLGIDAGGAGGLLAEGEELPDLVPEFGQGAIVDGGGWLCHGRILPVDHGNAIARIVFVGDFRGI